MTSGRFGRVTLPAPADCTMVSAFGLPVLQEAIKSYKSEKGITREDYIQLDWVFGPLIQSAFEIFDKQTALKDDINPAPTPTTSAAAIRTPANVNANLSNALKRPIVVFQCSKSRPLRVIVRVIGSKENYYWIRLTNDHFSTFTNTEVKSTTNVLSPSSCQCVSYKWRKDICKHILAAYFYLGVTDKSEFVEIDEFEFDRICETVCAQ